MENNTQHITSFNSGTFKENETKWEINRKELLSVLKALLYYEIYIIHTHFILRTDNTQVKFWLTKDLKNQSITTRNIRNIVCQISLFNFDIELISTKDNFIADFLSRHMMQG